MSRLSRAAFFLIPALCIFTTLAYGTVHQPIIALFYVLVTIIALLWAFDGLSSGVVRFSMDPIQIPLLLLGIYALVQIIPFGSIAETAGLSGIPRTISMEPFSTQVTALHIFFLCAFFSVSLVYIDSASRLRRLVTVITVFGFIYAFYAILQSVLSPTKIYGIYGQKGAIPFGSFVNKHNYAAIMEMAMSIPLGLLFVGAVRSDKRLLYIVATALMGSSLLLSGSRGGLIALIAEIILLIIITSRSKGKKNILLKAGLSLLLVAAAVGGAIFVGGDTSLTRFADSAKTTDITSSRSHIWGVTIDIIKGNLQLGAGLGAYASAYPQYDTASGLDKVEQSHNDYLQILADAGIVGLIIGALFLFWFFREGIRNIGGSNTYRKGVAVGVFAGCCAVLVHSLFDFVLHITAISVMFLTLLSMLVASGRKFEDDIEESDQSRSGKRRGASVTPIGQRRRRSEHKREGEQN
ncbi:O-antigen ligase [soil metagenome]